MTGSKSALAHAIDRLRHDLGVEPLVKDHPLVVLSGWDQADPAWGQLARTIRCKPEQAAECATEVLLLILDAFRKAPNARGVGKKRELIVAEYDDLFSALDRLRLKFSGPEEIRILGERIQVPPATKQPQGGFNPHEVPPETARALEVMRAHLADPDATGPTFDDPGAEAFAERLRVQRDAPRELDRMRRYLEREKNVLLVSLEEFPSSRKEGDSKISQRAFALMLGNDLQQAFGRPCHEFVTAVTTVLFFSDHTLQLDNVLHIEAVKAFRAREQARNPAGARRSGNNDSRSTNPGSKAPEGE